MRTIARSLACLLLIATVGCASWLLKGEPPEVLVMNVTPLEGPRSNNDFKWTSVSATRMISICL